MKKIILASASPRRHELLAQLGVRFEVLDADIDESRFPGEAPGEYAERLARAKATEGWRLSGGGCPVMGADTIVVLGQDILLKPVDRADAQAMLRRLSGRTHIVISAVALARDPDNDQIHMHLGYLYDVRGQARLAAAHYTRALDLTSNPATEQFVRQALGQMP